MTITIELTAEEEARLKAKAERAGLNPAELLRPDRPAHRSKLSRLMDRGRYARLYRRHYAPARPRARRRRGLQDCLTPAM
jgi:hypothetical protein